MRVQLRMLSRRLVRNVGLPILFVALPPSFSTTDTEAESAAYRRILDRAIDRAQTRLQERLEIGQDHSTWPNAWEVTTEHYLVRSTHSRFLAADIAQGLEQMLVYFKQILSPDWEPTQRFSVFVFPDIAAYNNYGNSIGAAEHSSFYGSFYDGTTPDRAVALAFDENRTLLKMQATHSALHQFVASASSRPLEVWASEGLAAYFSLFWNFDWGKSEFRRIADGSSFIPLRDLLNATLPNYGNRTHERFIELGMMFSYLLNYRADTRTVLEQEGESAAPVAEALRAMLDGSGPTSGWLLPLVGGDLDVFEAEFRAFGFGD